MDFLVYVASDVRGAKLNLLVPYHRHTASIERFLHTTSLTFDAIAEQRQLGSLAPFAAAYIFSDAKRQWDPLTSRAQLSPCCQVYVFRDDVHAEAVGAIPDPVRPSHFFAPHRATARQERSWAGDASPGPRPPAHSGSHATSSTPIRLASSRWVLPSRRSPSRAPVAAAAASTTTRTQPTVRRNAVAPPSVKQPAPEPIRVSRPLHLDRGTETEEYRTEASPAAYQRESTSSSAPSHGLHGRVMSPAPERQARRNRPPSMLRPPLPTTTTMSAVAPLTTPLPQPWSAPSASTSVQHPTPLSRQASSLRSGREDVQVPRLWYDRPRCAPTHVDTTGELSGLVTESRRPSALSHSDRRTSTASTSWSPGCDVYARVPSTDDAGASSGRGGSILREERERVEKRMRMSMDELRTSLKEEDQQLRRTLSGTPQHPRSPLHTTPQR